MGRISLQKPTLNILPISSLFTQCCVPIKKKKSVKKQVSFTSNPNSSHHSAERTAKTAPITKGSTSKNMSRGSSIVKYLNDTASKVFKRTYSENSPTASFSYNNMSEIQEYLSKSLEYLHQKINSFESGIHNTTGNILPDNTNSEVLEELLNDYLHNYHADNETHSVSLSEVKATHLENKIFLNTKGNKKAKIFLKNFEKTNELTVNPSIIGEFITLFTACEEINKINSALLMKQAFPHAKHEKDIANVIMNDERTYNTFMDLNKSYFEKPKNRIKNQNDKEEITHKIADFLENNPDFAMRFYKETHAIETALYTIESLQKELFPETHIYLKENDKTEEYFSKTRIYQKKDENDKIESIISVIQEAPDYTNILRITAHNYNICDLLNLEEERFTADDQDIVDILLYFKENAQKDYKQYLQLLPMNEEFYKAIQEFETSGEYPIIRTFSDVSVSDASGSETSVSEASSDTSSFRGSLSFRNLSLQNIQDAQPEQPDIQNTSEQPDISVNIALANPKIQLKLAKVRDYKKEIFPNDDTPENIVHNIFNNQSMKDILLSLYYKQDNSNPLLPDENIVADIIHNPENHSEINLKFHALLSLKQQLDSLTQKKSKGLASLISKKPTRLKNIQKSITSSKSTLSNNNTNIYFRLLTTSEDIGMSSDAFNDILETPEKLLDYIKEKYTVEGNFPVLPQMDHTSLTVTKNNSFKFETDQPEGFRVAIVSSTSQNKHIITHDLWNGYENNVVHPTPTIISDTSEVEISFLEQPDIITPKAVRMHADDSEHHDRLHYKNNDNIPHTHILYKNKSDMLSTFKKDFPEQAQMMGDMFINGQYETLSPEPTKEEASASSKSTKTLSHSQTFPTPTSRHKKTLTLSQSFPELTSITEIEEETSSAKDDTREFKPEDMFHRVWGKDLKTALDKTQATQTSPLQKLQSFKSLTCGLMKPQTQESESSSDTEDFSFTEQSLSLHSSDIREYTYDTHDTNNKRSFFANTEEIENFEELKNALVRFKVIR